jgi:hypothetical protein
MTKKDPQSSFAKDFNKESTTKGFRDLGDAVGMPDEGDWKNITNMIAVYRQTTKEKYGQDFLVDCISNAKKEYRELGGKYDNLAKGFNLANKESNMRFHFEFPESFLFFIEKGYPTMFRNKKHYAWFCKNFKELMIPDRY